MAARQQVKSTAEAGGGRTERAWWAWHDADASRWSPGEDADEATRDAARRCAAWIAGDSSDGPYPHEAE